MSKQLPPSHTPIQRLLASARARALKKGLDFSITEEDIDIPEVCPILHVPLVLGNRHSMDDSPSIDRIDSSKGYVPGNVWIISHKANRLKSDKDLLDVLEELETEPEFEVPKDFNFKDTLGRWRTESLFIERSHDSYPALYSLHSYDNRGYQSLKNLYLGFRDPTEYSVATKLLGGWEHWLVLTNSKWFGSYVEAWRDELEVMLRSEALTQIIKDSASSSKSSKTSARYIADGDYKGKKRGRPSKVELEAEKKRQLNINERVKEDAERIGLRLVSNEQT